MLSGSGFKISDKVQGQGVPRIGSGAYTAVREHFNARNNSAIGPFEPFNHLLIRCEIPLLRAGRWGFETTFRAGVRG
jgi:hypothetical protein